MVCFGGLIRISNYCVKQKYTKSDVEFEAYSVSLRLELIYAIESINKAVDFLTAQMRH
jgi:hypothetical protein